MQLKNIVLRDRDRIKALMDNSQNIPVTSDFLLIPVPWSCFLLYDLSDARIRGDNAFYGI